VVEHEHESEETEPAEDDAALEQAISEASGDTAKTPGDEEEDVEDDT
jgi:hypothetical protein